MKSMAALDYAQFFTERRLAPRSAERGEFSGPHRSNALYRGSRG